MNTVSIYFFRLSDMAPGVLNDCCLIVPAEGEAPSIESLSQTTRAILCPLVVPPQTALNMKLLRSPRYATWLAFSLECPVDLFHQTLELLARGVPGARTKGDSPTRFSPSVSVPAQSPARCLSSLSGEGLAV